MGAASIWLSIASWNEIRTSTFPSSEDHEQIKIEHKDVANAAGVVNATLVGCYKNLSKYKDQLLPSEFLQEAKTRPPNLHKKNETLETTATNNNNTSSNTTTTVTNANNTATTTNNTVGNASNIISNETSNATSNTTKSTSSANINNIINNTENECQDDKKTTFLDSPLEILKSYGDDDDNVENDKATGLFFFP